jgi:uncharacterized membrane protein YqjE
MNMYMMVGVMAALIGLLILVFYPSNDWTKMGLVCTTLLVSVVCLYKTTVAHRSPVVVKQVAPAEDILSNRPDGTIYHEKVNKDILMNR